jgi:RNA polymerase sigma-70 factor (ECF subfamily)
MAFDAAERACDGRGQSRPVLVSSRDRQAAIQPGFEEQVLPHRAALRTLALTLCKNSDGADDLVQDTLVRALGSFRAGEIANVRGWLFAVLHNLFIDQCRRGRNASAPLPANIVAPVEEPATNPAWATITSEELAVAVSKLDEEFRVVFQLFEVERRSYDEIAARLRIPKATVGTRLVRARRKLRDALLARGGQEASHD